MDAALAIALLAIGWAIGWACAIVVHDCLYPHADDET